jgi:hypothetical protein
MLKALLMKFCSALTPGQSFSAAPDSLCAVGRSGAALKLCPGVKRMECRASGAQVQSARIYTNP